MINRVQAFNNKNNYKQDFGMAFVKDTGRNKFNALVRTMGTGAEDTITRKVTEVTEARKGDHYVDIIVKDYPMGGRKLFAIGVYEKDGTTLANDGDERFFSLFGTSRVEANELLETLDKANNYAANAEKTRTKGVAL